MMRNIKRVALLTLCIALLAVTCVAQASYGMPYDDTVAYIQAVEDAMDARYGSRGAWPRGYDTLLAIARYYGGIDETYAAKTLWVSSELQAWEMTFASDISNRENAHSFIYGLMHAIESFEGFMRTWPYEAQALLGAAQMLGGDIALHDGWALPTEDALPCEKAMAIAKEALQEKYGLTDEEVAEYGVYAYYTIGMSFGFGSPFWSVTIGVQDNGAEVYYAYIASPSGEVLVATRNDGNG